MTETPVPAPAPAPAPAKLSAVDDDHAESVVEHSPYVGRVAICYLAIPHDEDPKKVYEGISQALKDDPRVDSIDIPPVTDGSFQRLMYSSYNTDGLSDDKGRAPDPYSHVHTVFFTRSLTMHIRAPRRLQKPFQAFKYIPAEEYWAVWDGATLAVIWESASPNSASTGDLMKALSPSGGLIVQQILHDAAVKCEYHFRALECSQNCTYTFTHTDLVLESVGPDGETLFHDESSSYPFARVELASEYDPYEEVTELYREVAFSGKAFAVMATDAEVMEKVADLAHADSAKLLQLNYMRADAGAQALHRNIIARWRLRGWKRRARRYLARINLALATLEQLRNDWVRFRGIYDRSAKDENNGFVFKHEYDISVEFMATLEVTEVRSAIGHLTESMDTHALVLATAAGAIVGAIVGALIGTLL